MKLNIVDEIKVSIKVFFIRVNKRLRKSIDKFLFDVGVYIYYIKKRILIALIDSLEKMK